MPHAGVDGDVHHDELVDPGPAHHAGDLMGTRPPRTRPMRKPVSTTPSWLAPLAVVAGIALLVVAFLVIRWYTTPLPPKPLTVDAPQQGGANITSLSQTELDAAGNADRRAAGAGQHVRQRRVDTVRRRWQPLCLQRRDVPARCAGRDELAGGRRLSPAAELDTGETDPGIRQPHHRGRLQADRGPTRGCLLFVDDPEHRKDAGLDALAAAGAGRQRGWPARPAP